MCDGDYKVLAQMEVISREQVHDIITAMTCPNKGLPGFRVANSSKEIRLLIIDLCCVDGNLMPLRLCLCERPFKFKF